MKEELRVLIVDDETQARDLLRSMLSNIAGVKVIAEAANAKDALNLIESELPDLIILDIELGGETGLDLVGRMRASGYSSEIIFITAYNQYAVQAIRHAAFDYLLKPIEVDELKKSINRLRSQKRVGKDERMDRLLQSMEHPERFKINVRSGFLLLDYHDLIYAEADGNYTVLHLVGGMREVASQNLGKIIELLPTRKFARISRSMIINLDYLVQVNRPRHICILNIDGRREEHRVSNNLLHKLEQQCNAITSNPE